MTQEEAKNAAEIIKAYADGKEIEFRKLGYDFWEVGGTYVDNNLGFNFLDYEYRIKSEPTYRPFKDKDECWAEMQKHQPFGWVYEKLSTAYININSLDSVCICGDEDAYEYNKAFEQFTFADGKPFGIKEG